MKKRLISALCTTAMVLSMTASMPMTVNSAGRGDLNRDGVVNTFDVREMMKAALNSQKGTTMAIWGDYNADGVFNTSDARAALFETMTAEDDIVRPTANFAKPSGNDYWGENAVNVLGDSISFGVGTSNDGTNSDPVKLTGGIPERSYVSFVKKAVQKANSGKMNYGFTSAYPTAWPGVARSEEIHAWPDRSEKSGAVDWVCDNNDDGNRLTSVGMTSKTVGSKITYRLRKDYVDDYAYFCVYYHCVSGGGQFSIVTDTGNRVVPVDGAKEYISTNNADNTTRRTKFYPLSGCSVDANGSPKIAISHYAGGEVTITGIGYYKTLPYGTTKESGHGYAVESSSQEYVTFNSFTRGGISLINLSDDVLDKATSADTFIMGLGFNDFNFNHARVNKGEFKAKIDTLIRLCNQKGTRVIVNDYVWNNPVLSANWVSSQASAHAIVKSELRRFARETGGVYVDQQAIWGDAVIDAINNKQEIGASSSMTTGDNIHPNHAGHKMMAKALVEAMDLEWTESWT